MRLGMVAGSRVAATCAAAAREVREQVGHLEARAHGLGALVEAALGLVGAVEREHAERDGDAGLDRGELQPARRLARDVVEVRRVAADHAAERDDAGEAARLRERHRGERELERARHGHHGDRVARRRRGVELGERRLEQPRRHVAVEPRDDDADGAALAGGLALEHGVAGRHGELAGGMLHRGGDVIGERRRGSSAPSGARRGASAAARPARLVGSRRLGAARLDRRRLGGGSASSSASVATGRRPAVEDVLARGVEVRLVRRRRSRRRLRRPTALARSRAPPARRPSCGVS